MSMIDYKVAIKDVAQAVVKAQVNNNSALSNISSAIENIYGKKPTDEVLKDIEFEVHLIRKQQ